MTNRLGATIMILTVTMLLASAAIYTRASAIDISILASPGYNASSGSSKYLMMTNGDTNFIYDRVNKKYSEATFPLHSMLAYGGDEIVVHDTDDDHFAITLVDPDLNHTITNPKFNRDTYDTLYHKMCALAQEHITCFWEVPNNGTFARTSFIHKLTQTFDEKIVDDSTAIRNRGLSTDGEAIHFWYQNMDGTTELLSFYPNSTTAFNTLNISNENKKIIASASLKNRGIALASVKNQQVFLDVYNDSSNIFSNVIVTIDNNDEFQGISLAASPDQLSITIDTLKYGKTLLLDAKFQSAYNGMPFVFSNESNSNRHSLAVVPDDSASTLLFSNQKPTGPLMNAKLMLPTASATATTTAATASTALNTPTETPSQKPHASTTFLDNTSSLFTTIKGASTSTKKDPAMSNSSVMGSFTKSVTFIAIMITVAAYTAMTCIVFAIYRMRTSSKESQVENQAVQLDSAPPSNYDKLPAPKLDQTEIIYEGLPNSGLS